MKYFDVVLKARASAVVPEHRGEAHQVRQEERRAVPYAQEMADAVPLGVQGHDDMGRYAVLLHDLERRVDADHEGLFARLAQHPDVLPEGRPRRHDDAGHAPETAEERADRRRGVDMVDVSQNVFRPAPGELEAGEHVAQARGEVLLDIGRQSVVEVPVQEIRGAVLVDGGAPERGHVDELQRVGDLRGGGHQVHAVDELRVLGAGQVHHRAVALHGHEFAAGMEPAQGVQVVAEPQAAGDDDAGAAPGKGTGGAFGLPGRVICGVDSGVAVVAVHKGFRAGGRVLYQVGAH